MRKIDKSAICATEYKTWVEDLDRRNQEHPSYRSDHKYYYDALVGLLNCQGGFCAYTEILIASTERCSQQNFDSNGRYIKRDTTESGFAAQLDHFDSSLKDRRGWNWENFFAVFDRINTLKRDKAIDDILKPDRPGYDPFHYLDYDSSKHLFFANANLLTDEAARVTNMIDVLGLNYGTIVDHRRMHLSKILNRLSLGIEEDPEQFFTAFTMSKNKLGL